MNSSTHISEIDACYDELANIEKQFDELRNEVTCPGCGAKCKDENTYCSKCGAKLPEKPAPEVIEEKVDDTKGDE